MGSLRSVSLALLVCLLSILANAQPAAEVEPTTLRLIPQELYGKAVINLLDRKGDEGVLIMQFNFFTDNRDDSYPKKIAQKLLVLSQENANAPIVVALEGRKGAGDPKGAAQRNAKTKELLKTGGIEVQDVYGQTNLGVSHTKLVMAGDEIIAGSSNLTKQSTDVGANNEMNIAVHSPKLAAALRTYAQNVIANPGQMVDVEVEDGDVRLLTDRLHFPELISQIKLAQKGDQLGLSMYQFLYRNQDDTQARQVLEELLAAHKRGALLEIYLNRADDLSAQNTAANLRVAELLLQNNVSKVYFDSEDKISHSKFLYRVTPTEKVALISSVNIYRGDFNDNHQLSWVIKNATVTEHLVNYFKQQIAYDGVLVNRIPKDSVTGLRYKVDPRVPEKIIWNKPEGPKRMLRFWRGFKQDAVSPSEFERKVNERLIPETIEVGGRRGLTAYLPSFFSGSKKPDFLPDEVAIIDYLDEETYNAIRTTERGRKYGPLHFEEGLFARQNTKGFSSGSLVALTYSGTVEVRPEGRAYLIGQATQDWQSGVSVRRTLLAAQDLSPAEIQKYLSEFQESFERLKVNGAVAVVDPRYLIMMINAKDAQAAFALNTSLNTIEPATLKKFDHIVFSNPKHGETKLQSGSGISVQFEARLMPRDEAIEIILKELERGCRNGLQSL